MKNQNFLPYPTYQDSGISWVGKIPSHWEKIRCRFIFNEIDKRSQNGSETHLSMTQKYGLIPSHDLEGKRLQSESYAGGKLCRRGDLVLNRLKAHLGVFSLALQDGVVSPDYSIFRSSSEGRAKYYEYLFKTPSYVSELRRRTKGIVEGFWRLYTGDFYNVPVLIPPIEEQDLILCYLTYIDKKVNKLVRKKEKLIDFLNEQKQAIIHHAVTQGLDPNVSLSFSGIKWIGQIPAHWRIRRIKYLLDEIDIRSENGDEALLKVSQYTGVTPRDSITGTNTPDTRASSLVGYKRVSSNDFVINIMLAWNGSMGVSSVSGIVSPAYCVYRFNPDIHPWYFHYLLKTPMYLQRIKAFSRGVIESRLRLYSDDLGRIRGILPPYKEQKLIVDFIKAETQDLDTLISKTSQEIDLVLEYRSRLISDVVTGQVDVRGWQPPPKMEKEDPYFGHEA